MTFDPLKALMRFLSGREEREAELMRACNHYLARARQAEARAAMMAGKVRKIREIAEEINEGGRLIEHYANEALEGEACQATAIRNAVDVLVHACHGASMEAGWWSDLETGESLLNAPRIVPEKLMLSVSELAEAMEGHRKNLNDDKLKHRKMIEVEIADCIIRLADLAGAKRMDLGGAVAEKMAYNKVRPDHQIENRLKDGGKSY